MASKKLYYIKTYGCQMNVYDSQRVKDILLRLGYTETTFLDDRVDLVILNTCSIREKAVDKMYSDLGRIREIKESRIKNDKYTIITIMGCIPELEGDNIFKRAKYVDLILGPQSYHEIKYYIEKIIMETESLGIEELQSYRSKYSVLKTNPFDKFDSLPEEKRPSSCSSAFITIQEGCNNYCTFCIVPHTRGREFCRSPEQILEEVNQCVDFGVKEIVLLGQNVNAYKHNNDRLSDLIDMIAKLNGVQRIKYTTSHPKSMTKDLIAMHGTEKKLSPALHLPVQCGSDRILKKMNRKYSRDQYFSIIQDLRDVNKNIVFSSDFIVGFPSETEQDFLDTIDLIEKVNYGSPCFSFKYSPRPMTTAQKMDDQVPEEEKAKRLDYLQKKLEEQKNAFNQTVLNKTVSVLFDNENSNDDLKISGRNEYSQVVLIGKNENSVNVINSIQDVVIEKVNRSSLEGKLI